MSQYRFNIKIKTKAQNICQKAAYNARTQFKDYEKGQLTKKTWKSKDEDFLTCGISLPIGTPERLRDRETLWNEVNNNGKAYNSRMARSIELNIPNELNDIEGTKAIQDYALKLSTQYNMIVDWAIHKKKNNFHAHLLIPDRQFKNNKWQNKATDSYECINNKTGEIKYFSKVSEINLWNKNNPNNTFERQPLLDDKGNQKYRIRKGKGKEKLYKKEKVDLTGWASKETLIDMRKQWETIGNKALKKYNKEWSCESYETIYKDLDPELRPQPTQHLGLKQHYIEKKEKERCLNNNIEYIPITKTGLINKTIFEHNSLIKKLIIVITKQKDIISEKINTYNKHFSNNKTINKSNSKRLINRARDVSRVQTYNKKKNPQPHTSYGFNR